MKWVIKKHEYESMCECVHLYVCKMVFWDYCGLKFIEIYIASFQQNSRVWKPLVMQKRLAQARLQNAWKEKNTFLGVRYYYFILYILTYWVMWWVYISVFD
jgi:hypothetical protein